MGASKLRLAAGAWSNAYSTGGVWHTWVEEGTQSHWGPPVCGTDSSAVTCGPLHNLRVLLILTISFFLPETSGSPPGRPHPLALPPSLEGEVTQDSPECSPAILPGGLGHWWWPAFQEPGLCVQDHPAFPSPHHSWSQTHNQTKPFKTRASFQ
jgi:hypothetical protein